MSGAERRSFQAAMALKYCRVMPAKRSGYSGGAARRCNWAYTSSARGSSAWAHKRPSAGIGSGKSNTQRSRKRCGRWRNPRANRTDLPHGLQYTRLTAAEALAQLRAQGFPEESLPSPSTMAEVLNRNGYRLRKVIKAKPQKNSRKRLPSSPTSLNGMASP